MSATLATIPAVHDAPRDADRVATAFAEFRRTYDCPILVAVEAARLAREEPLTVQGRWYPQQSRHCARHWVAVKNVRALAQARLDERLAAIFRREG